MSEITKDVHPQHYQGEVEPIDLIISCGYGPDYCAGNVIKYVARYHKKGGIYDLKKAQQYLEWLIELEENKETHSEATFCK